ncbi:MAG: glycosyltransferase family 4 protein [Actinobacteria bacterium]|nr:glycosyltransferase family 4 protein [Actinomycetota bacterium]
MRVTLTNPYCWPYVRGGSESTMHGLCSWLRAQGHDASILAGGPKNAAYEIDGLPYRTVKARDLSRVHRELVPPVTMIPAMRRRIKSIKPDVVHAFSYHDAFAAKRAELPYVLTIGGIIAPRWRDQHQFKLFKNACTHAEVILCASQAPVDALKADYGFDAEIVPYGLDVASFAPDEERVPGRILCVATANDNRRRPDFLVTAFGKAAVKNPDAHLVFCGAADDDVQQRVRSLLPARHRDKLTFLGDLGPEELRKEYARASLTALTSLNEAFGIAPIESLASGTPVVGTRSGALAEIITNDVGALSEPEDVNECARQIQFLLDESGPALSARCIERAQLYDWDAIGPKNVAIYERATTRW